MEQNLSSLISQLQKNIKEAEELVHKISLLQKPLMPEMIAIPLPAGRAYLPLQGDLSPVELSRPYEIGKYLVTQELWESVMGNNPSHFKTGGPNLPVENVTWHEAVSFCERLSDSLGLKGESRFRLPTEWEWEWAAGSGEDSKVTDRVGWHSGNSEGRTHPVGEKEPNTFGLYDTLGNVLEWTASSSSGAPEPERVFRGGSCYNDPAFARVAYRDEFDPGLRSDILGFRLARTIIN